MSSSEIAEVVFQINKYTGLPGILFFLGFLRTKKSNTRIVFYVLLASFLGDVAADLYIKYIFQNSHLVGQIWVITNYLLLSWLFLNLLPDRRKTIIVLLLFFTIGTVVTSIFFYSFFESNTFLVTYPSVAFTYLSIVTFIEILKEEPTKKLVEYPLFWIVTAIFLFNSVTLLKNLFMNYLIFDLQVSQDQYLYVWLFGVSFNMLKNLMFFYAFILVKKGNPDYIYEPKNVAL